MKSYLEVIEAMALTAYRESLRGTNDPFHCLNEDIIAFIYDKPKCLVMDDIRTAFELLRFRDS